MIETYSTRIENADKQIRHYSKINQILAFSRLAVLLGGAAALFQIAQHELVVAFVGVFLLILVGFFFLVFKQSQQAQKKQYWEDFRTINQNELNTLQNQSNLYDDGTRWDKAVHAYASDLDILGQSSLYAYVNRCATYLGQERFSAQFLGEKLPKPTEIASIHQEVRELGRELDWCQDFQIALFAHKKLPSNPLVLLQYYLEKAPYFLKSKVILLWIKMAPFLMLGLGILAFFNSSFWGAFVFLGFVQLMISVAFAGKVSQWVEQAEMVQKVFSAYSDALKLIEKRDGKDLGSHIFRALESLIQKLNYRNNMLVGSLMNFIFFWDFRQIAALEKWRSQSSEPVYRGLEVVTEHELLVSLATLHRNHPQWSFPEVMGGRTENEQTEQPLVLEAHGLAHPLIPHDRSVANDYHNEDHRLALITGSNMAGKSTFLRTIGTNLVLAYLGAPICGRSLKTASFRLISFMRIKDSLVESTSTFKAELDRIQWVLQEAEAHQDTFVLLDEMLRGTNSVDKFLGSKAIIQRFLSLGTYGLIATHDLKLSELEQDFPGQLKNFHFDIQMVDQDMHFDYLLKTGACTKFNAAILLKGIGISI